MTKLVISQVDEQHFRVSGELTRSSIGDEKGLGSQAITKHKICYFDLSDVSQG